MFILKLLLVLATSAIWAAILFYSVLRLDAISNMRQNILRHIMEYIALLALATLVVNICLWITGWSIFIFLFVIVPLGSIMMFSLIFYKTRRQVF